ncbi:MAG: peptidoglycan-binding domain-containing protein [Candidatus Rokuibacteriota bacterium]
MRRLIVFAVAVSIAALLTGAGIARSSDEAARPAPRFVREAQQALRDLGYRPGPVDGVVGPRTKGALAQYQRAEKIQVTGRLDAETMVRLDIHERLFSPPLGTASAPGPTAMRRPSPWSDTHSP